MLTLGPSAGEHVVTVDLPDRPLTPPVTFMATAGPKSPERKEPDGHDTA